MAAEDTVIEEARRAALEVLHYTARGPRGHLPRTAGWGYAEPYTRDWMIAALGILTTGDAVLVETIRRMLVALAAIQGPHGQIPGLADAPADRGSSDTTPLFLIGLALYRRVTGEVALLEDAAGRARAWMAYQSDDDRFLVAQQPTSDWRDEQWVLGHGLYVNTLVYAYLRLYGDDAQAAGLAAQMNRPIQLLAHDTPHGAGGLLLPDAPYYALWAYKVWGSTRFDLLGNSLAILTGLAPPERARAMVAWIEAECAALWARGDLALDLPPCLFPYIRPADPDWFPRYAEFNRPGEYHNGGVWPFVCGFYVAALVAAGARAGCAKAHRAGRAGAPRAQSPGRLRLQRMVPRAGRHAPRRGLAGLVGGSVSLRAGRRRAGPGAVFQPEAGSGLMLHHSDFAV
jgi:hypothetical protein